MTQHEKEYRKQYSKTKYLKFKDKILKQQHVYYVHHKNKIKEYNAEYNKQNASRLREQRRLYWLHRREDENYKRKQYPGHEWRKSYDAIKWRREVYKRDDLTCQDCGKTHCRVYAHHIKSGTHYPKLRFDITNGVTLCYECHVSKHKTSSLISNKP